MSYSETLYEYLTAALSVAPEGCKIQGYVPVDDVEVNLTVWRDGEQLAATIDWEDGSSPTAIAATTVRQVIQAIERDAQRRLQHDIRKFKELRDASMKFIKDEA